MSHYDVNAGVPKTLIQYLIRWVIATDQFDAEADEMLEAILGTEISPELVPADAEGEAIQSTEAKIGPYELQDFHLYYTLRYGLRPSKVAFLALHAWRDAERGRLAAGISRRRSGTPTTSHDPELARGLPVALLRVQPVQALGHAERPEGRRPAARCRRAATGARPPTAMPGSGWRNCAGTSQRRERQHPACVPAVRSGGTVGRDTMPKTDCRTGR